MSRKVITTTVDEELYKSAKILAINLEINLNDLIEEGLIYTLNKYENIDENEK